MTDLAFVLILVCSTLSFISGFMFGVTRKGFKEQSEYRRGRRDAAAEEANEQLQANRLVLWHEERRRMLTDGQYMRRAK